VANDYLFTSESVSEGHPDKVADQISDAILDANLTQDKYSRVAAETLCNTGLVVLAGEITTTANVDYIQVARDTIKRIGYDNTDTASTTAAAQCSSRTTSNRPTSRKAWTARTTITSIKARATKA